MDTNLKVRVTTHCENGPESGEIDFKLVKSIQIDDIDKHNIFLDYSKTAFVPKKLLYIKLKRQRLLPTELVIQLPKIEPIDNMFGDKLFSEARTCSRKNKSVQCHVCLKTFETVHRLKAHMSRRHMKSWLKCEKCRYKTTKHSK